MASRTPSNGSNDSGFRRTMIGLATVAMAVGAHVAFKGFLPKHLPFAPFAAAVLVSCRCGGGTAGLVATVASTLVLRLWFLEPAAAFWDEGKLGLGLFVLAGLIVSWQGASKKAPQPAPSPKRVVRDDSDITPFEYAGPVREAA